MAKARAAYSVHQIGSRKAGSGILAKESYCRCIGEATSLARTTRHRARDGINALRNAFDVTIRCSKRNESGRKTTYTEVCNSYEDSTVNASSGWRSNIRGLLRFPIPVRTFHRAP